MIVDVINFMRQEAKTIQLTKKFTGTCGTGVSLRSVQNVAKE